MIGLIGGIVILIAIKQKGIKLDKISTTLIQHIAILDIFTTLVLIFPKFLTAVTDRWLFGAHFCTFQAYFKWYLLSSTAILVCALNCTKLAYVLFPLRALGWKSRHGHYMAASVRILTALPLIVNSVGNTTFAGFDYLLLNCALFTDAKEVKEIEMITTTLCTAGLLCIAVVIISGVWLLVLAIRKTRQHGRSANVQGILTVVLIAAVYCVSYMPLLGYYMILLQKSDHDIGIYPELFCRNMPYLNYIANPFIYIISLKSCRGFLKIKFIIYCARFDTRKDQPRKKQSNVTIYSTACN
jgi:uncharacterized membrane protein